LGEAWLPVSDDHEAVNVATEHQDPKSYLNLYRQLLALRRMHPALSTGDYEPIAATEDLLAYIRHSQGKRLLIVINLGGESSALSWDSRGLSGNVLLSTHMDRQDEQCGAVRTQSRIGPSGDLYHRGSSKRKWTTIDQSIVGESQPC
jgi:alpha-glucosidase